MFSTNFEQGCWCDTNYFSLSLLLEVDLFPTVRKTGEFVMSTILTIFAKKGGRYIPTVGVISTGTAGFARMEGSCEVASSVLNNFHPLLVTLSLPCNVFYHRITQRGQQGRDADVDDRDNEDWRWSLNKKKQLSSLRIYDFCCF